ncbi:MAG: 2-amino-4-hydroxy-6-hydroxymethyldihydropteridine diphosphokinase [Planctomycetota bacterium]
MSVDEEECLIAFGANQGDREGMLRRVIIALGERGFVSCRASRLYRTKPIGGPAVQAEYGNAVIRARTAGRPREVVARMLQAEAACGRERTVRWAPRTVDLDLLLLGQRQVDQSGLSLPHPRMLCRRFVLEPACEIAADMLHPWSGARLDQLAAAIGRATPFRAVWLWPNFDSQEQQRRWETIQAGLAATGIGPLEVQAARGDQGPGVGLSLRPDGITTARSAKEPSVRANGANGANGANWHILVLPDPLQLSQLPWSPGLLIGWQQQPESRSEGVAAVAREAVRRHVGATVFVDEDMGETARELAAALTAVAEFWREPAWPAWQANVSAADRSELG